MRRLLCRLLPHARPIREIIAEDQDGREERHTCPRCGHVEIAEYDDAGERLLPRKEWPDE